MNCEFLGMDMARLRVVPGFYKDSLRGKRGAAYGLTPESVSLCLIDCDIYEPTKDALDFIGPLLEPGALMLFDDWFLCRASPNVGERAAALDWLKENPSYELIEFDRHTWQNRWFVFQKKTHI